MPNLVFKDSYQISYFLNSIFIKYKFLMRLICFLAFLLFYVSRGVIYLLTYLSIHSFTHPPIYLFIYLFVWVYFLFMCRVFCLFLCVYVCTTCIPGTLGDQKRVLDPHELELQIVMSLHLNSGN